MKGRIQLVYEGKQPEEQILDEEPRAVVEEVRVLGQPRLDRWRNRLILGENLTVLRLLLRDEEVRGKVRLVYIDPPFATQQTFAVGRDRTATISRSQLDWGGLLPSGH